MFRRRRPVKDESTHFSFDSFLDLVTNVVGIIIRLILVTWVGARSYHASMEWLNVETSTPEVRELKPSDDPLHAQLQQTKNELDDAKTKLLERLKGLDLTDAKAKDVEAQLALFVECRRGLEKEHQAMLARSDKPAETSSSSVTLAQVRQRAQALHAEIKKLEAEPVKKKEFKYHAPLSRTVATEELFFECKEGRVTYIDLPAFMREIKGAMDDMGEELKTTYRVERRTSPVGPYRLRFAVERERGVLDAAPTPAPGSFRFGMSEWVVEPLTAERGETLEQALRDGSAFRKLTDPIDARLTTVTFWVYPDSFEAFRQLRDHLYERGHDVAARPLPVGVPIAASRHGTASRGQ